MSLVDDKKAENPVENTEYSIENWISTISSLYKQLSSKLKDVEWRYVPIFNLWVVVFFGECPDTEVVQKLLQNLALIDALMLAGVLAQPLNYTYDELIATYQRWNTDPFRNYRTIFKLSYDGAEVITNFQAATSIAVSALSISLFSLLITDIITCSLGGHHSVVNNESNKIKPFYWLFTKYILLLSFLSTIIGIFYSLRSWRFVIWTKFPDMSIYSPKSHSTSIFTITDFLLYVTGTVLMCCVLILSMAVAYQTYHDHKDLEEELKKKIVINSLS
jgi:hypothetical protein